MEKTYNPQDFEKRIYKRWMDNKCFTPPEKKGKKKFSIVQPPPNITGQLHVGHSMDVTIADAVVRFKRMKGYDTLWLPGIDHASIATEMKVVEAMRKDGVTKADLGRDGFLKRAWEWKEQYGNRIVEQCKTMGVSLDWSRMAFTMDERCSKAVREVFVNGVYARRQTRARGARGVSRIVRARLYIPRRPHNKLVPGLQNGDIGCRGRIHDGAESFMAYKVSV